MKDIVKLFFKNTIDDNDLFNQLNEYMIDPILEENVQEYIDHPVFIKFKDKDIKGWYLLRAVNYRKNELLIELVDSFTNVLTVNYNDVLLSCWEF